MPLELDIIETPTEEQFEDLIKIYSGYADTNPNSIRQWLQLQLDNGFFIFGGLFNGNLIASAIASKNSNDYQLANVCVREITRRRGVARQLLMQLTRFADKEQTPMTISVAITPSALNTLLEESGFKQENMVWAYTPNAENKATTA